MTVLDCRRSTEARYPESLPLPLLLQQVLKDCRMHTELSILSMLEQRSFKGDLHREDTTPAEEPKAETSCPSSLSGVVQWSAVARGIFPSSEDLHTLNYASESLLTARKFPLHFLHGTLQSSGSAVSCKGNFFTAFCLCLQA